MDVGACSAGGGTSEISLQTAANKDLGHGTKTEEKKTNHNTTTSVGVLSVYLCTVHLPEDEGLELKMEFIRLSSSKEVRHGAHLLSICKTPTHA